MEIVFVVTGNVRGWEVSVIMFTSILTVTVGPSPRRVRSKSIYRGLMQPLALLKGRFIQITEESSRSEKLFFCMGNVRSFCADIRGCPQDNFFFNRDYSLK